MTSSTIICTVLGMDFFFQSGIKYEIKVDNGLSEMSKGKMIEPYLQSAFQLCEFPSIIDSQALYKISLNRTWEVRFQFKQL